MAVVAGKDGDPNVWASVFEEECMFAYQTNADSIIFFYYSLLQARELVP